MCGKFTDTNVGLIMVFDDIFLGGRTELYLCDRFEFLDYTKLRRDRVVFNHLENVQNER